MFSSCIRRKEILSNIHNLKGKIQKMYIQIKIKTVPYKLYNKCDIKTQNKNNKVYFISTKTRVKYMPRYTKVLANH